MIRGLYETHINVVDLERSIAFYRDVLGLPLAHREAERRVAFLWVPTPDAAMLGLWETSPDRVRPQHFAFRATVDDVLHRAVDWLAERGLPCHNFLRDKTSRPMVFAWMPAVSIYFFDPDGHELELIAMLPDRPRPECGVLSWDDWQRVTRGEA